MIPTIEELEAKIRAAIEMAKQKGWRIEPNCYADGKSCCPLGATVIGGNQDYMMLPVEGKALAMRELHVSEAWVDGFVMGFDGLVRTGDPDAFDLGQKFREELMEKS